MLANGAKETTTTTGTGTVTLSAVTGFPRFSQVLSVGQFVDYAIQDGNNWEWGVGKVGASNTLERTLVTAKFDGGTYSKNPATGLSLSGSATVFCSFHEATRGDVLGGSGDAWVRGHVVSATTHKTSDYGTSFALPANSLHYFPFVWPVGVDRTLNSIAINVTTTGTATKVVVGVYELGNSFSERKLLIETGPIDVTTTGLKSFSLGVTKALPLSRYVTAVVADGTVSLRAGDALNYDSSLNINSSLIIRQQYRSATTPGWTDLSSFSATPSPGDGKITPPMISFRTE